MSALMLLLLTAAPGPLMGLDADAPGLEALYKDLHQNPELSFKEVKTAAKLAARLRGLGFEVTEKVGGTGLVAVMKNGAGPTVMLRTDLDALPVEEKTGLPYASHVTDADKSGLKVGVMHACAHDLHMTVWAGTAALLAKTKASWRGTLVMLGQPAEEEGNGARAMIKDGLFTRFPKPDVAVALHAKADLPAGVMGTVKGFALANVDSVEVTLYGRGGHGASPHTTVDPVVLAARYVLALQTLVSRETNPIDPAVVTVGSLHVGTRPNIIADEAKLQLTLRSYKAEVRQALVEGVTRLAKAESVAARSPKEPLVVVEEGPAAVYNDPALTERLGAALSKVMGEKNVVEVDKIMGAEDFGEYSRQGGFPSSLVWLGGVEPTRYQQAKAKNLPLPSAHSPLWAPDPERSIRTGVTALTTAALELLGKP